jgi:hypothetical protein
LNTVQTFTAYLVANADTIAAPNHPRSAFMLADQPTDPSEAANSIESNPVLHFPAFKLPSGLYR